MSRHSSDPTDRFSLMLRSVAAHRLPMASLGGFPDRPLPDSDWHELTALVDRQRVWSLLADAITDGALPATDSQADEAFRNDEAAVLSCLHLDRLLSQVWPRFVRQGIDARVFKGITSALCFYPTPGLRTYSDVDLLVPSTQFAAAVDVLTGMGARRHNPDPRKGFTARLGKSAGFSLDGGWEVDLHRSPQGGPFGAALPTDDLFEEALGIDVGAESIAALSYTHLFMAACYHAILPRDERRLVPLLDVAHALNGGLIDEADVRATAERWHGTAVVVSAVRRSVELFGLPSDTALLRWTNECRVPRRQERWLRWSESPRRGSELLQGLVTATAYPRRRDTALFLMTQVFHDSRAPVWTRAKRVVRRVVGGERREAVTSEARPVGVAQIIDSLDAGGSEHMAVDIANLLDRGRFRSFVIATRALGPLAARVQNGTELYALQRRSKWDPRGPLELRKLVRDHEIAVLHSHGRSTAKFVALLRFARVVRVRHVMHDHDGARASDDHVDLGFRLAVRLGVDEFIGVDERLCVMARDRIGMPPAQVRLVRNGVDSSAFRQVEPIDLETEFGLPPHRMAVVSVANLRPVKDHPTLIRALARSSALELVHVILVGDRSDEGYVAHCLDLAEDLGVSDHVCIAGPRPDVPRVLAAADIGILSSSSESGPLALLEYMAAGIPFVATDAGEIARAVAHRGAGVIVPTRDPVELAAALDRVALSTKADRVAMGETGRLLARTEFDQHATVDAISTVYVGLASADRSTRRWRPAAGCRKRTPNQGGKTA